MSTAETIARALRLRRAGREFTGRCPACGYKSGFTVTERGGAILACCHAGGCSQAELWGALDQAGFAARAARDRCMLSKRRDKLSRRVAAALGATGKSSDRQAAALAVWQRSRPAQGTMVETYLREARGYTGPIPAVLRFALGRHPSDPGRRHPMMVAAVLRDGRIVAVHRTFLRADGRGKADLAPDKMTLGPCKGAAVSLAPAGPVLAIAEGIESALGYMQVSCQRRRENASASRSKNASRAQAVSGHAKLSFPV